MEYRNPVVPGCHPDPTVCRVGSTFYLATSSFEYFPGVPLYRSDDLVSWDRIGHCLTRDEQLDLTDTAASDGVYAPTLRHHDGTFFLVTTDVSGTGNFLVTADDPAGEWSDPISLDAPGFDPDLFVDGETAYLTYAHGSTLPETTIRQAEVDLDTGAVGEERELWQGIEGTFSEAPHLYERDGTYYLLTAEGGTHTNHMVVAARSDHPTGPFEGCPDNPVLSHRGHPMADVKATGHGDLVRAPDGSWWLVFLGVRQHGGHPGWHHLGRETFLAPVEWEDGWPVVDGGDPVTTTMQVESLPGDGSPPDAPAPARPTRTTFDGDSLDGAFEYRRNPDRSAYSLDDGDGLTLRGRTERLGQHGATFVGRRQAHFDCRTYVDLAFDPEPGEEAGLAAVMDERHRYEVGVTRSDGTTSVVVRRRIGNAAEVVAESPVSGDGDTWRLAVDATTDSYRFLSGADDPTELATLATRYLATEVSGSFTGVYLGMYATSGDDDPTPARFERFVYEPTGE
ncbi:glycoside hydrolase family 43 protein [Halomarina salina]|uniref:Glycoside hydrolase family 43 protein n=1 Tax=Halomarina salina TaxID=1872699 RepID=A0ABD5RTI9_9EURY|nr:glycoside hydrolase family 43 protein [Halomarina salina]